MDANYPRVQKYAGMLYFSHMKSRMWLWVGIGGILCIGLGIFGWMLRGRTASLLLTPLSSLPLKEKPLEKYTIDNLSRRQYTASPIVFGDPIATAPGYSVLPFSFTSDAPTSSLDSGSGLRGAGKKVTGLAHVPMTPLSRKLPVIVQFRGYADRATYTSGLGTKHSAEVFAKNGFVSLAPDFLGYGGSDKGSEDVFEDRFETYTTALTLLASIPTISFVDPSHVFLWGHSNGGQIALSVLTILGDKGKTYPTSLWAAVTKKFPYSILFYTDEFEDYGKALRKELAGFEQDYDTDLYAFSNYLDRIQAPIIFHQGTADEEVPESWSRDFVNQMREIGKTIKYYTYPGADHNLSTGWNTVVGRDVEFFKSYLSD